jgi:dipeptidyl aminopeptidase/acylaminoacyl peptidase
MHRLAAVVALFALAALIAATAAPRPQTQPVAPPAAVQPPRSIDAVLDRLDEVHTFRETAVSPDGSRIAWVENLTPAGDEGPSRIFVRDLPGAEPQQVTAAAPPRDTTTRRRSTLHEHGVAWSPDGRQLAFLSDARSPGQLQLFTRAISSPARGGRAARAGGSTADALVQCTNAKGQLATPRWSPDGSRIAVLYVAGSTHATGALVPYQPDAGVVGEMIEEQRIAVHDVGTARTLREISPPDLFVYDYDWAPDATRFAAEAARGSGTNNYWVARLYTIDAATGVARSTWQPSLQIAQPRWSPDGRSIALIHGLMSDEGVTGGDVWVVPAAGGEARNLTPDLEGSARAIAWRASGEILIDEYVNGESALVTVPEAGGARTKLRSAADNLEAFSSAAHADVVAAAVRSFAAGPEVYAGKAAGWTRQTSVNAAIARMWGEAKSLHWTSDGFRVQGFLLYPVDYDASRRYPLVVSVHGGPSSAYYASWPRYWDAVLPSQGYFVLLPNPRGSYGSGEAFTRANVKDFGYGDLRDILAGVDAAAHEAPIDPSRVGIAGWSYGGYMTMWAVTQTTRFRAAVAGAGIANWQSYYGQNRIDTWMLPFFGASVYDDPQVYARSSPITFIKNVRTPTLVLHGDRDSEVPTPQGYEFWHALKALGVPTELVIYRDEGHMFVRREDQRDRERRLVGWFDKWMPATAAVAPQ